MLSPAFIYYILLILTCATHKVTVCSVWPTEFLEISFSAGSMAARETRSFHLAPCKSHSGQSKVTGQSSHDSVQIPSFKFHASKTRNYPRRDRWRNARKAGKTSRNDNMSSIDAVVARSFTTMVSLCVGLGDVRGRLRVRTRRITRGEG